MRLLSLWSLLPLLASCGDDAAHDEYLVEVARFGAAQSLDLDILFVIDDSPSTLEFHDELRSNFPVLLDMLHIDFRLPSLHLGVVSADLGTRGSFDDTSGPPLGTGPGSCADTGKNAALLTSGTSLVAGSYIVDLQNSDGIRTTNYSGSLATAFTSIASLGSMGCGFQQHLEAAKRALDDHPANVGFLRPSAKLAVVIVADKDDCSMAHSTLLDGDTTALGPLSTFRCTRFGVMCAEGGATPDEMNIPGEKRGCGSNEMSPYLTTVGDYVTFFEGLKSDPEHVLVAAISGDIVPFAIQLLTPPGSDTPTPRLATSCTWLSGQGYVVAAPGVRLADFATRFGLHAVGSACRIASALAQIGWRMRALFAEACLTTTPAMPYDCIVSEQTGAMEDVLPVCTDTLMTGCYAIEVDPGRCRHTELRLVVHRVGAPAPGVTVVARCKV
jgi:hypothetical protein